MDSLLIIGAIFVLLLLSALFSGSETALTAVSRPRIHRLSQEGSRGAQAAEKLVANRERLIGAVLLGNNLVNILASTLAASFFLRLFGDVGVAYATLVMTVMVVIFSEVMPKTYAILNTERVALAVAPVITLTVRLFGPLVSAVQFIVRSAFRLFGANIEAGRKVLSAHEELSEAIDLHLKEGGLVRRDRDMLGGVLELRELEVGDVMVHRKNMVMVDMGQPCEAIVEQVLNSPHTRIPLWKDDPENIVGILHAKDLLRALKDTNWDMGRLDIAALITTPWYVPETTPLQKQLSAFLQRHAHFALVVDEYGALMGLITLEDIIEEIVGEITDEHDITVSGVRTQNGVVYVDGTVPIRDLNRAFDWNLPDDEATTIAGLVIHEAQTIPEPKQVFTFYGFKFEIVRRQRNQITALRITPPPELRRTT